MESAHFSVKGHEVKIRKERIKEVKGISENIARGVTQSQTKTKRMKQNTCMPVFKGHIDVAEKNDVAEKK